MLSFPAPARGRRPRGAPRHLGDIVLAYETVAREARRKASRSTITSPIWRCMAFCTFWATITNRTAQAEAMERRERRILARLGVPDPYADARIPAKPDADRHVADKDMRQDRTMAESEAPRTSETADPPAEIRNLPVPVPANEPRDAGERWLARILRAVFGWKTGSIRSDLKVVLEAGAPGDTGFSPEESAMLKNILGLRERRIANVMVPRADIVAVQEDIPLGDLVKVFETAAHSRLVVYHETLDDPIGMVHIRDLIAFMTARATVDARGQHAAQAAAAGRPRPARARPLADAVESANILRPILFVPPSMPAIDLLAKMQATRIHLALVIDEYGGTDGLVSIEDLVELIVGDIEDEHDEGDEASVVPPAGRLVSRRRARRASRTWSPWSGAEFDVAEASEEVEHARRLSGDPHRPRAGARRAGAGAGPVRDRGARR